MVAWLVTCSSLGARCESGAGTEIFVAIWFGLQHASLGGIWDLIDIGGTMICVCDIIFDFSVGIIIY